MNMQYMKMRGYDNANTTKEALEGQPEIKMLRCASERGIYRKNKHENRKRKRIQHEENVQKRADDNRSGPSKGK